MDKSTVASLLQLAEPLAALSITHLTPSTRQKLAADDLSVNAYPNEFGGFVYVGAPRYNVPAEADLAAIFEVATVRWPRVPAGRRAARPTPCFVSGAFHMPHFMRVTR